MFANHKIHILIMRRTANTFFQDFRLSLQTNTEHLDMFCTHSRFIGVFTIFSMNKDYFGI